MQGRTSFVIAQRISTVLNADQILVLDKGRIVARGTHEELLETSEIYADIYSSQLVDDSVAAPRGQELEEGRSRPMMMGQRDWLFQPEARKPRAVGETLGRFWLYFRRYRPVLVGGRRAGRGEHLSPGHAFPT